MTDLISDFGIASMLNYTTNHIFGNNIYGMINMEAIPKFDIKSVIKFFIKFVIKSDIKSDIKFDISIKPTTYMDRARMAFGCHPSKRCHFAFYKSHDSNSNSRLQSMC